MIPYRNNYEIAAGETRDEPGNPRLRPWTSPHLEGTWAADFYDPVKPLEDEIVITKRSVGPFVGTELDRVLRVRDINTIASMGVATNYVVESAVREGVDRGLKAVVLADCCASATEQTHDSVRVILPDLCSVMTADDFIDLLAGSGSKEPRQTS